MFKDHEKFWAFLALLGSILALAITSVMIGNSMTGELSQLGMASNETLMNSKLRILDGAVVGLIGIAGMAAQSLFKHSVTEEKQADTLNKLAQKTPPVTGEARDVMEEDKANAKAKAATTEASTTKANVTENVDPWNKEEGNNG